MRRAGAVLAALASLGLAALAHAGAGEPRTLVVRGHVRSAEGVALAGARLEVRGTATMSAVTDSGGRYTLIVPMGSAAGLKRGPFTLEVRASARGRRVALAGGAPSLSIEVAAADSGRVRVRSSLRDAEDAIEAAFAASGESTAWVTADFGGAVPAVRPAEARIDSSSRSGATADSLAQSGAPAPHAHSRGESERRSGAEMGATGTRRARGARSAAADSLVGHPSAVADSLRHKPRALSDSCDCRIVGTIEVDWERPHEQDFTVTLTAVGPDSVSTSVRMFMGSPREFSLAPLHCGPYALSIATRGRLRYALPGDSAMAVACRGRTQVRLVLSPTRR